MKKSPIVYYNLGFSSIAPAIISIRCEHYRSDESTNMGDTALIIPHCAGNHEAA